MSRAALWRQEGNWKERERQAEELFARVVDEGRQRSRRQGVIPLWGPDDAFHFNPLLLRNTIQSNYFQKCCQDLHDWNAVVDEIYYQVKSLQPFSNDKAPSSAFCLLLRLLTLRLTEHQLNLTLRHADSPYIRGLGFLYLRYAGPPERLLEWIEPFWHDEEELRVEVGHRAPTVTMGEFVRQIFGSREYYGTPLPRLPTERTLQVRILQAQVVADRAVKHYKNQERMDYFRTLGSRVMALYGDDENPLAWYPAVVDRIVTRDETTGYTWKYPKFVVTFTEYGNTETVALGEMDVMQGDWKYDSSITADRRNGRPGDNDGASSLYDEVRRRERDTATARQGWARRPPTTKNALSSSSGSRGRPYAQDSRDSRSKPSHHNKNNFNHHNRQSRAGSSRAEAEAKPRSNSGAEGAAAAPAPRKRSAEEMAAIEEKRRKLAAKYG